MLAVGSATPMAAPATPNSSTTCRNVEAISAMPAATATTTTHAAPRARRAPTRSAARPPGTHTMA
jgi:hypothetical protein